MELEPASTELAPPDDPRARLIPPPPVTLVAIADVTLPGIAGLEKQFDAFYVGLLRLERDFDEARPGEQLVYRAENHRVRLLLHEVPPPRQDYHALGVVIPSLADLVQRLVDERIEFTRQRGLFAGTESLLLIDPAGNPVEITESRLLF
jgi:hypothetical protein